MNEQNTKNENERKDISRKGFLNRLIGGIVALIGVFFAFPLITALIEPVASKKGKAWRDIGAVSDFVPGETRKVTFKNAGYYDWGVEISNSAAWVRRDKDNEWKAFSVNCSHLGCPVRWEADPEMFFCPCHGGAFYRDGSRAAGPPNLSLIHI